MVAERHQRASVDLERQLVPGEQVRVADGDPVGVAVGPWDQLLRIELQHPALEHGLAFTVGAHHAGQRARKES